MGLDELAGKIIIIFFVFPIILLLIYVVFLNVSDKVKEWNKKTEAEEKRARMESYGEYPDIKKKWRENPQYRGMLNLIKQRAKGIIDKERSETRYVSDFSVDEKNSFMSSIEIDVVFNSVFMRGSFSGDTKPIYSFGDEYNCITFEQRAALLRVIGEDLKKEYPDIVFRFVQDNIITDSADTVLCVDIHNYLIYEKRKNILDD